MGIRFIMNQPDPLRPPQVMRSPKPRWLAGLALTGGGILLAVIGGILRWG